MGLDITAYRGLKKVLNPILAEDGYPENYDVQWMPGEGMKWSESIWTGKGEPVEYDSVYEWEDSYEFCAGSYFRYNIWRHQLEQFKGDIAFQELIDFADNEGVIGSKLAKKLYNDFLLYHKEAEKYAEKLEKDNEWFINKYCDWEKAFMFASNDGAVEFH